MPTQSNSDQFLAQHIIHLPKFFPELLLKFRKIASWLKICESLVLQNFNKEEDNKEIIFLDARFSRKLSPEIYGASGRTTVISVYEIKGIGDGLGQRSQENENGSKKNLQYST